jgi:hypothetical protein
MCSFNLHVISLISITKENNETNSVQGLRLGTNYLPVKWLNWPKLELLKDHFWVIRHNKFWYTQFTEAKEYVSI